MRHRLGFLPFVLLVALFLPSLLATPARADVGGRGTRYTRCVDLTIPEIHGFPPRVATHVQHQAFNAAGQRTPEFDEICSLPTAAEAGLGDNRCSAAQGRFCEGGAATPINPRDIPNGGDNWFAYPGLNMATVRCVCGCFVGDTQILTDLGWHDIRHVALIAEKLGPRVALPAISGTTFSAPRGRAHFSVGPETVPVFRLATTSGESLTLTGKHPVLLRRDGARTMVQAKVVQPGDVIFKVDGETTTIASVDTLVLPDDDNRVYNVATGRDDGRGGVIAVNGLLMGDLTWQRRLSERASREENLLGAR